METVETGIEKWQSIKTCKEWTLKEGKREIKKFLSVTGSQDFNLLIS